MLLISNGCVNLRPHKYWCNRVDIGCFLGSLCQLSGLNWLNLTALSLMFANS